MMLHRNKDNFLDLIDRAKQRLGFPALLIEKDYYLTLILSRLSALSENLIFKGGTCLNKIYYAYYRLSEDLDFSMQLPADTVTRGVRRQCIQPIKKSIAEFVQELDMKIDETEEPGQNESKQYLWNFLYPSALRPLDGKIKFEIGLRFNPIQEVKKQRIRHAFQHPFTSEPLFDGGEISCLGIKEVISEKLRAAATRKTIAPRDFYDLDFILRKDKTLINPEVLELFRKKLAEDDADTNLNKYRLNLGRSNEEINDMDSRIKEELFDVLTVEERINFNLESALQRINYIFKTL